MLTLVTFDHKLLGWVKPMHGQPLDVPCFQTWQPNKKVKSVPFQGSTWQLVTDVKNIGFIRWHGSNMRRESALFHSRPLSQPNGP